MRHEIDLRRADYVGGIPITLGDGRAWAFPGPREISPNGTCEDIGLIRLLHAMAEADSEADQAMGELSLAIYLLGINYDLSPADYRYLLEARDGQTDQLRAALRDLAQRHFEALAPRPADVPAGKPKTGTRRFRLPLLRPHRPATTAASRRAAC
jgi:hypothetical protein